MHSQKQQELQDFLILYTLAILWSKLIIYAATTEETFSIKINFSERKNIVLSLKAVLPEYANFD